MSCRKTFSPFRTRSVSNFSVRVLKRCMVRLLRESFLECRRAASPGAPEDFLRVPVVFREDLAVRRVVDFQVVRHSVDSPSRAARLSKVRAVVSVSNHFRAVKVARHPADFPVSPRKDFRVRRPGAFRDAPVNSPGVPADSVLGRKADFPFLLLVKELAASILLKV